MPRVLALRALLALTAFLAIAAAPAHAAAPPNDDFANAEVVTGAPVSVTGTNAEATLQAGEPNHAYDSSGRSVWYRWVAPRTGTAVADTIGSSFPTTLAAYQGTSVETLARRAHMDAALKDRSRISFPVVEGQTYVIAVDIDYGTPGPLTLNLDVRDPTPGDSYAAPLTLTGSDATAENDTSHATEEEADPPSPDGYTAGTNSLWYEWTAPSDGAVSIDTAGSGFDTVLAVYTGDAPAERRRVAVNNDAGSGIVTSRVGFHATAGTKYRILVDGYSWSHTGPVKLNLHHRQPPQNDAFATAIALPSARAATAAGNNLGATGETGEPQHLSYETPRHSAWYSWTAPSSGSLTLKVTGDGFRPTAAVYTGGTLAELKRVANQVQPPGTETNQIRVRVEAGVTYLIAVDSAELGGDFALSLTLVDSPVNDDFANPLPLVGTVVDLVGSTVAATQEPCEPVHDDNYYDPSVWFTWTAPASGGVTIDTTGSDFPTVLGIYTGDVLCTLTRAPVNRLTGPGVPAKRSFRVKAGVTYRIAVDGAGGRQGTYKLSLRHTPPPANDLLADAQALTGSVASTTGTLLGATGETGETNPGGADGATAWYSWTAPTTGPVKLKLSKSNFTGGLSVHTGSAIGSMTQIVRGGASVQFKALAGSTYKIAVDGGATPNHGDYTLDLAHEPAPPNDDFAAAIPLAASTELRTGTVAGATLETGESPSYYSYGGTSVWYAWTAPSDGSVAIAANASAFVPIVSAHTGSAVNSLTSVAYSGYPTYGTRSAKVTFRVKAGTTYRIAVNSYDSKVGEFTLTLDLRGAPSNDAFGAALTLPSAASASVAGANLGATVETGERSHDSSYYGANASVWYAWTAPSRGALTIKATSDFQPVIAAYTGSSLSGLTRVPNQPQDWNGGPEQIRIRVEAGTTYYIAVDARSSLGGDFSLSLELTPNPANDDFADAKELVGLAADVLGSTLGATQQPCEPTHEQNYYDPSVWFTWTAPESGAITLDTTGSTFPTVLGIYTGDVLCTLVRVPVRRMATATPAQVKRGFRAVKGQTYRIAVDGVSAKMGDYKLSLRHSPAPANDMLADAQPLTGTSAEVSGTNFGATAEPGEPGGSEGATVWYSWTAPITGRAKVDLPSRDFDARVTPYTGDTPSALVPAAKPSYWSDPPHFRVEAGRTYRIRVDGGTAVAQGDFKLRLAAVPSPPNDDFAAAASISGPDGSVTGNLGGATTEPGENYDGYERSSVWYTWTAPTSDLVSFDGGYVGEAKVFTGDSLTSLTNLGRTTFRAQAGRTYRIAIVNHPTITSQPLTLRWRTHPRPENDDFAKATKLSGTSIAQAGTTVASTREVSDPPTSWNPPRNGTVWYEWTAPADGLASMRSSADDSAVTAYTGASIDTLTRVGGVGYYGSAAYFRARAGVTYRVRVESYQDSTYGAFTLYMGLTGSPANDDFDDVVPLVGGSASGTTTGATDEEGEPLRNTDSRATVWYSWTPTSSGTAVVAPGSNGHGVAAFRGNTLAGLERVGGDSSAPLRFRARAGETYRIAVDSRLTTGPKAFTVNAEVQPGPANDDLADAEVLSGHHASTAGSSVNATLEAKEPVTYSGRGSVWYRWTAPASGRVKVDLSGSEFDTVLTAYTGDSFGALTSLGTDNDSGDGSTSMLSVPVRAGTTYRFAVNGYYGSTGAVKLALSLVEGPPNDDFAAATEIGDAPAQASGTNVGATHEASEPRNSYSGSGSVWYRWTAKRSGRVTLDLNGTDFYAVTGVYEGAHVGALTRLTSAYGKTARLSFEATAGRTYRFSVDGDGNYSGSIKLALTQVTAPLNDDYASAEVLTGRSALVSGSNVAATWEPGETRPSGATGASVWYRWTAPATGTATLTVSGYANSPLTSVHTGGSVGSLAPVTTSGWPLRFYAVAGQTYYVRIAGMYGSSTFTLGLELGEAPANDLFADAKELAGEALEVAGSTVNATQESCEPVHDDNYYDPSVWYWWRAPSDGKVTLDTAGSSFPTVLGIYTGERLCELQRVAVERLSGAGELAKRAFQVTEGMVYRIAVDGQRGATGTYKLSLRHVPDPKPPPATTQQEQPPPPAEDPPVEDGPPAREQEAAPPPPEPPASEQDQQAEEQPPPVQEAQQDPPPSDPPASQPQVELPPEQPEDPFMAPPLHSPPQDTMPDEPAGEPAESAPGQEPAPSQAPPAGAPPPADPAPVDPPTQDTTPQDPPAADSTTQDPPAQDPPRQDPPAADSTTQDPPAQDPPAGNAPPADSPAPPAEEKLVVSASLAKQRLANALKSGIAGTAACTQACELEILVTVDPKAAKKAKLTGSRATSARLVLRSFGANTLVRFVVPLPKAARAKLAKVKSLPLSVKVLATGNGEHAQRTVRATLKR